MFIAPRAAAAKIRQSRRFRGAEKFLQNFSLRYRKTLAFFFSLEYNKQACD